jgi:hypothetical protein
VCVCVCVCECVRDFAHRYFDWPGSPYRTRNNAKRCVFAWDQIRSSPFLFPSLPSFPFPHPYLHTRLTRVRQQCETTAYALVLPKFTLSSIESSIPPTPPLLLPSVLLVSSTPPPPLDLSLRCAMTRSEPQTLFIYCPHLHTWNYVSLRARMRKMQLCVFAHAYDERVKVHDEYCQVHKKEAATCSTHALRVHAGHVRVSTRDTICVCVCVRVWACVDARVRAYVCARVYTYASIHVCPQRQWST